MTQKEKQIKKYLKSPIKIGDKVNYGKHKSSVVTSIVENGVFVAPEYGYKGIKFLSFGEFERNTYNIGYNPMLEKPWNSKLRVISFSLESIIYQLGYKRENRVANIYKEKNAHLWQELNYNPTINGVVYQRPFCWSLEQKQLLIESIYQNINIGMIVVKKNRFSDVENLVKQGKVGYFKDCVDGKQRLNAIFEFVNNKFSDKNGYYFKDFSDKAINSFMNFSGVSYGELEEGSTDEDVKSVFLGINFTGVQMSKEHIEFVKNIKL